MDLADEILASVKTDIIAHEVELFKLADIRADDLGIICNNGAVIVVVAEIFIEVIAHAGIENVLDTLLYE